MINLNNLSMGFTNRTLFKDVNFSIFPNEKIGLTGPNGAGKTTLYSIILGETEPLAGNVQIQKNLNIGYLPQESNFKSDRTVMEEVTEGDARIRKLMVVKRQLEDENKADSEKYGDVLHELEQLGIYDLEHKAEKILSGLGFSESDFHRPIAELSGGWQMRTLLGKLLTYSYDLLLLDEPTNYLDLSATIWLKEFLSKYDSAFVLISHDRLFLNDVTNYTIILDHKQMTKVKGNYQMFEHQRSVENKSLEKKKKVVDKKRKQLERFTQRFHAQPNRAAAVKNKRKMIDKLEEVEITQERQSIKDFKFPPTKESGYVVVNVDQVSKSYGDLNVYKQLDLEIIKNQKICLVGPNGAGKSTLLKMLAGVVKPDEGKVKLGHEVERGYFSQTRLDVLNPNRNAFEEVASAVKGGTQPAQQIRDLLALFNYYGDDVFKSVKVLSGGEKSRLILAKLLISPPNFMLLDEPTTHLDLDGVKALTEAIKAYRGTLCFISHDLYFIKEIADTIVEVSNGQIKVYPGGLQYYLDKKGQGDAIKHDGKKEESNKGSKQGKSAKVKNNKKQPQHDEKFESLKEKHKQAKKQLSQIKNEIKNLEKEKQELDKESYVKSRTLTESYENRDQEKIKIFSKRLKEIQSRLREVDTRIAQLEEEKIRLSK